MEAYFVAAVILHYLDTNTKTPYSDSIISESKAELKKRKIRIIKIVIKKGEGGRYFNVEFVFFELAYREFHPSDQDQMFHWEPLLLLRRRLS